jgi:hypothetical protein
LQQGAGLQGAGTIRRRRRGEGWKVEKTAAYAMGAVMTPAMITVWDGSHHGIGADLLCVPAEVRREPEPIKTYLTGGARKALVALSQRPMTSHELAQEVGWSFQTARHALYQLRNSGAINSNDLLTRRVKRGKQVTELLYWLAGVDYEGLETGDVARCDQNGSGVVLSGTEAAR